MLLRLCCWSLCALAPLALGTSRSADFHTDRRRALLAAVARAARDRRVENRDAAGRVERYPGTFGGRWRFPGRGSASPIVWGDRVYVLTAVPADVPLEGSHAPRGASPTTHQVRGARDRSRDGAHRLGAHRARRSAARNLASAERHLGLELGDHEWRDPDRAVRVARPLCVRHERHAAVADRPRRQAHAPAVRRGQHADAVPQPPGRGLGSHRRIVHHRRSTRGPARKSGGRPATKSTPGPRRSCSNATGARR